MKQTRLRSTLIAAMMTFAASATFGQDDPMTTKIPFAFRVVGSDLPAGRYMVSTTRESSRIVALLNQDTGKKVFIRSSAPISESKAAGRGSFSGAEAKRVARWQDSGLRQVTALSSPLRS